MSDDKTNVSVSLNCEKCGSPGIIIPDNPSDDSVITCPNCKAEIGTIGQLNARIKEGAFKAVEDAFGDTLTKAFGNNPNFTIKRK